MTTTVLYTDQNLQRGFRQITKTALGATTTALSLVLKLENLLQNTEISKIRMMVAVLNDVGTFNTEALTAQVAGQAEPIEITPYHGVGIIRFYKLPLTPADGSHLYTWLEVGSIITDSIRATLDLNEF